LKLFNAEIQVFNTKELILVNIDLAISLKTTKI